MLETIPAEAVEANYQATVVQGITVTREAFAAHVAVWNAQIPAVNGACDPDGLLREVSDLVVDRGPGYVGELIEGLAGTGRLCHGCATAARAAAVIATSAIGMLAGPGVVAEATALTAAASS